MEQLIGPWRVDVDVQATREAFDRIPVGGPEECGCAPCRNFAAGRAGAYPAEALALLERLGIRADREAEVSDLGPCGPREKSRLYSGWFHFVGRLLDGPAFVGAHGTVVPFPLAPGFSIGVHAECIEVPDAFQRNETLQLEFMTEIPWTLDEFAS